MSITHFKKKMKIWNNHHFTCHVFHSSDKVLVYYSHLHLFQAVGKIFEKCIYKINTQASKDHVKT